MLLVDQVKLIKTDALVEKRNELQIDANGIYGSPASLQILKAIKIIDTEISTR